MKLLAASLAGGFVAVAGRGGSTLVALDDPAATPVPPVDATAAPSDDGACTQFILAGGPSPSDPIQVDDDLTVYLNDTPIFQDSDGVTNIMPPFPFQAGEGDQLTVAARDAQACGRKIGALWLHCADGGDPRFLTGGQDDGCDPDRPVPENFYRESWRI